MLHFFGPNLVILARTCDELSRRQAHDWPTHGHTQAMIIPEGQNWPRAKMAEHSSHLDVTTNRLCLALTGELLCVSCEFFGEAMKCYITRILYWYCLHRIFWGQILKDSITVDYQMKARSSSEWGMQHRIPSFYWCWFQESQFSVSTCNVQSIDWNKFDVCCYRFRYPWTCFSTHR